MARAWAFVQLTRPMFLFGGALMYALGAAIAYAAGAAIDWGRYLLGQIMVTAIQAMTHYANEYFDFEGDCAIGASRTWFSGGSGVLPAGRLSRRVACRAAEVCAAIALAAIVAALRINPVVALIGGLALLGGWFYSAPPLRLVATGFGESSAALMVAFLVPLTALLMQSTAIDWAFLGATLPLIPLNLAMQLEFEFIDYEADREAGKRTLSVRLGRDRAIRLHHRLVGATFALSLLAFTAGWIDGRIAVCLLVAAPLAARQIAAAGRASGHRFRDNLLAAGGVGLFALASTATLTGVLSQNLFTMR